MSKITRELQAEARKITFTPEERVRLVTMVERLINKRDVDEQWRNALRIPAARLGGGLDVVVCVSVECSSSRVGMALSGSRALRLSSALSTCGRLVCDQFHTPRQGA